MIDKCVLETQGYQVIFNLKRGISAENFDLMVNFQFFQVRQLSISSVPTFISATDLQRLMLYLQNHVNLLKQNPDCKSETFVNYGLGFQLQALEGDIDSEGYGEFSIQVLVNIGEADKGDCSTYIGGLSVATLDSVEAFILSIKAALSNLAGNAIASRRRLG